MDNKKNVGSVTAKLIYRLENSRDSSSTKAYLANLRHSVGKEFSQTSTIWPMLFEELPEHYLSYDGVPTYQENAIVNTLQLFAIHQQGKSESVQFKNDKEKYSNIGKSLKLLRTNSDQQAMDRRFNVMITSSTYKELIYHLRQLIRLLRQSKEAKVDYPQLAEDLFYFQLNGSERIKLKWAQSYYFVDNKEEKEEENSNE